MKKPKSRYSSSFHIIYIFLILAFVAGITFITLSMFVPKKQKDSGSNLNTTTNETEKQNQTNNTQTENKEENNNQTPKQNEDESDADEKTLNASITMNEVNNGKYTLRVTIYELVSSGNCTLHMESARGDTLDRTARIIDAGANSSSCEGFDIATNGISSGSYNFTINLKAGEKSKTLTGIIQI